MEEKLSSDPHTHAACSHVQTDRQMRFLLYKEKTLLPHQAGLMLDRQWGTPEVPGQARPAHSFTATHTARPLLRLLRRLNFKELRGHRILSHTDSLLETSFQTGQAARLPCSNPSGSYTSKCTRHWVMTHGCRRQTSKSRVLGLRRLRKKDLELKTCLGYRQHLRIAWATQRDPVSKQKNNKKYRSVAQW